MKNGTEIPCGDVCWSCGSVATQSYPHMEWGELVSKAKTSSTFASEIWEAKTVLQGSADKKYIPESLCEESQLKVQVQKSLLFLTLGEFEQEYKVKPSFVNLDISEIQDEQGRVVKGIFLTNPSRPFREVIFSNSTGMHLSKSIMSADMQLRANQGSDLCSWLMNKKLQAWKADPPTPAQLSDLITEGKRKEEEKMTQDAKERAAAVAAPLAGLAAPVVATATLDEQDGDDEGGGAASMLVDAVGETFATQLAAATTAVSQGSKARPKQKGRGRGASRGQAAKNTNSPKKKFRMSTRSTPTQRSSSTADAVGVQVKQEDNSEHNDVGSTGGKQKLTEVEKCLASARKWAKTNAGDALCGYSIKSPICQITRSLRCMEVQKLSDTIEYANLKAKSILIDKCVDLHNRLGTMVAKERTALMSAIAVSMDELPIAWQTQWLQAIVRDATLACTDNLNAWVSMVEPFKQPGAESGIDVKPSQQAPFSLETQSLCLLPRKIKRVQF